MGIVRPHRWFLAGCLLASSSSALAGSVGLAWSPAQGVKGYRVYYGTEPGVYTAFRDVGNRTFATITGLSDCKTWYLAVKAYNRSGESAGFSNEISGWPRPEVASADPAARIQGSRFTLDVSGANFAPGATMKVDNPHVHLDSVSTVSCNRIQAAVSIEPAAGGARAAPIGRFTLTVSNPDGVFGLGSRLFEVRIAPARFDVDRRPPSKNRLDGRDTIWISRGFASREGQADYRPDSDFNGDGWVDGNDLAYLVADLGKCWTGSEWSITACEE